MKRQGACAKCLKVWGQEIERYLKEIDDLKKQVAILEAEKREKVAH